MKSNAVPPTAANGGAPVEVPPAAEAAVEAIRDGDFQLDDLTTEDADLGPDDPFDLAALTIGGDGAGEDLFKTKTLSVPVHKPDKTVFVRVNPDPAYSADIWTYTEEDGFEKLSYLVVPSMIQHPTLAGLIKHTRVLTVIDQFGGHFLWPVPVPSTDKRRQGGRRASKSAMAAAADLTREWGRLQWNAPNSGYDVISPRKPIFKDPDWSKLPPFAELMKLGYGDMVIRDASHDVIERLDGSKE
jgi:hypothetical protein